MNILEIFHYRYVICYENIQIHINYEQVSKVVYREYEPIGMKCRILLKYQRVNTYLNIELNLLFSFF